MTRHDTDDPERTDDRSAVWSDRPAVALSAAYTNFVRQSWRRSAWPLRLLMPVWAVPLAGVCVVFGARWRAAAAVEKAESTELPTLYGSGRSSGGRSD